MTDTNIDKSPPFTIVPDRLVIAISRPAHIRFLPLQQNLVEFNLVLLPTHISVDSVTSLADVQKFGGKILATPSALVELQPVEQK
jgi:hypothetical protein